MRMTLQQKYKILVVDDEPDLEPLLLQRMRRAIRAGRYEFVFAGNGLEALHKLDEDETIDMVLSDINMPQMDGLTLLDQIPEVNPNIRSVIISAYGDMKNIRTAMNRGAFDFVTKPIDFKDLQVTIDRTLNHVEELKAALSARDKLVSLQNELDVASNIQQSILPTELPQEHDYQMFGSMKSARNVGGDFYDVVRLPDRRVGLAIADVSDKGVPAALFMMSTRTLLKGAAIGAINPGDVIGTVNQLLCEDNEAAMFVTLIYGVYDPETGRLTYANGGHNPPLIVHSDNSSTLLPPTDGLALGLVPGYEYQQRTVTVAPGEALVLYTDGVTEAMNGDEEEFGVERLQDIFKKSNPHEPYAITRLIFDAVDTFAGDTPQSDDVTCLTLCRG
ncbi:Protein IcfG [Geodia barretti]|uniref:Protein IcfG n=1 Tax=Geodia barretti TaxID=519541 RepID=A0AA35RC00_GEOBA|nr:Protein IcfG [Geodia barretti]